MTITVKIIERSISANTGIELTTMELYYPRIIHSEFMTHRVFARNASSSRAIPVARQIKEVWENPAEPSAWGANQPGMQAGAGLSGLRLTTVRAMWHTARVAAIGCAWVAMKAGAHKQIVNRILEPWSHIRVVVTSTYWNNFFALRDHEDADPTIRELAKKMNAAYVATPSQVLRPGEWHLPYIDAIDERDTNGVSAMEQYALLKKMSAARCARVSYNNHHGKRPSIEADLKLYEQLAVNRPVHASPLEHQATPDNRSMQTNRWLNEKEHGCFTGWRQFRKQVDGEAVMETY